MNHCVVFYKNALMGMKMEFRGIQRKSGGFKLHSGAHKLIRKVVKIHPTSPRPVPPKVNVPPVFYHCRMKMCLVASI